MYLVTHQMSRTVLVLRYKDWDSEGKTETITALVIMRTNAETITVKIKVENTQCLKNQTPMINMTYNFTYSQYLLIIVGRERPYSVFNWHW